MDTVRRNPAVLFDDTRIAPHGQKLMGSAQAQHGVSWWAARTGE
jgi:hypothetical protein